MSHSLRYQVNCSTLFSELPLLERPAAAGAVGFDAVEFWWRLAEAVPTDREVDAFGTAIEDAGVRLIGLNFFAGDMAGGDRGLDSPARSRGFRDNIEVTVGIGERLGCSAFNALYGNRVDDAAPEQQDELGAETLALAPRAASRIGGTVLVEPVSGADRYPLKTTADALVVIDRVQQASGVDNLLADLYHLAVNGDDVDAVIAEHAERVAHVQIADDPGRKEPGTGDLPLDRQLASLEVGYAGWLGLSGPARRRRRPGDAGSPTVGAGTLPPPRRPASSWPPRHGHQPHRLARADGVRPTGDLAVVELADASGLGRLLSGPAPLPASTVGTGAGWSAASALGSWRATAARPNVPSDGTRLRQRSVPRRARAVLEGATQRLHRADHSPSLPRRDGAERRIDA